MAQGPGIGPAARVGEALTLCVLGPAGVGKTTVLDAWVADVRACGVRVWRANAEEMEATSPYAVLRQLLTGPVSQWDRAAAAQAAEGAARLAIDIVLDRPLDSVPDPGRVANAVHWLVHALTESAPAVIVVDDAQWADAASMQALARLAARVEEVPVALAVAARDVVPAQRSAGLSAFLALPTSRVLSLAPLSADAVAQCVADGTGHPVAEEFAGACVELTGGNPFLVGELTGLVVEAGLEPDESGVDRVHRMVPTSVVDAVLHRLAALGAPAVRLVRAVAVLEHAPLRLAASLAELDASSAAQAADDLRDQALLDLEDPLRMRHGLLVGAVLEAVGAAERARLRRRAAHLLLEEEDGLPRAAEQLLRTDGMGEQWVVECLVAAARAASEAGAPAEAERLLARAVSEPPAEAERGGLLLEWGSAQLRSGHPDSVATLRRALSASQDPATRAFAAMTLAMAFNFGGAYEASVEVLSAALADLEPDSELALVVEAGLVQAALQLPGRAEEARARLAAHDALSGASPGERFLLGHEAAVLNATSAPVAEVQHAARAAIGDGSGHPEGHEWTLVRLQLAATGAYAEVLALCEQGLAEVRRTGSVIGYVGVSFVSGFARLWRGDLVGAEADFRACIDLVAGVDGGQIALTIARAGLVEVLLAQGRITEASGVADLDKPVDESSFNGAINMLRARAMTRHALGDHAGALADLDECARRMATIRLDNPPWCPWRAEAIAAHWASGEVTRAAALVADELEQAQARRDPVQRGIALRWAGLVAKHGGADLLEESVTVLAGTEAHLECIRSEVEWGAALRREGQRRRAADVLLEARARAAQLGARGLQERAEAELSSAGRRPRRLAVSGLGSLTASERRVCELAAGGMRNRDIAQHLFVSPKTVEVHLSRSFRKLGVARRDELALLLRQG